LGPKTTENTIEGACITSNDSGSLPRIEVSFGILFDPDCQASLKTSCEATQEGDTLVVTGEASWRDKKNAFCASNDAMIAANCEAPTGWENATTLDWGEGFTTVETPPLVGLGQGSNEECSIGCQVAENATTCQTAN